jgi:predicted nucleic acid-binding protein
LSVLVDSDVWSELLRKVKGELSPQVKALMTLLDEAEEGVILIGAVRQEVLSGWRERQQFERVRELLRDFPDQDVGTTEYELAAEYFNTCRSKGIQGSHTDFLMCACSATWDVPILTRDQDYPRYAEHVHVRLYAP